MTYGVYDANDDVFGPSLFVAYQNMTIDIYKKCRKVRHQEVVGDTFDGTVARKAIERVLNSPFLHNERLSIRLSQQLGAVIDESSLAQKSKMWKFAILGALPNNSHAPSIAALPPNSDELGISNLEEAEPHGAGFGNAEENRLVEAAAVRFIVDWYESKRWTVRSVERDMCGYDLSCRQNMDERHVEVKGARGSIEQFMITSGEVRCSEADPHFELFLVTNALTSPKAHRYSGQQFLSKFSLLPIQYQAKLSS